MFIKLVLSAYMSKTQAYKQPSICYLMFWEKKKLHKMLSDADREPRIRYFKGDNHSIHRALSPIQELKCCAQSACFLLNR